MYFRNNARELILGVYKILTNTGMKPFIVTLWSVWGDMNSFIFKKMSREATKLVLNSMAYIAEY